MIRLSFLWPNQALRLHTTNLFFFIICLSLFVYICFLLNEAMIMSAMFTFRGPTGRIYSLLQNLKSRYLQPSLQKTALEGIIMY